MKKPPEQLFTRNKNVYMATGLQVTAVLVTRTPSLPFVAETAKITARALLQQDKWLLRTCDEKVQLRLGVATGLLSGVSKRRAELYVGDSHWTTLEDNSSELYIDARPNWAEGQVEAILVRSPVLKDVYDDPATREVARKLLAEPTALLLQCISLQLRFRLAFAHDHALLYHQDSEHPIILSEDQLIITLRPHP